MARIKDLVPEYRAEAAKLSLWLEEHETAGDRSPAALLSAKKALQSIRAVQRLLDGYYEMPRDPDYAAVGWKAGVRNDD